MSLRSRKLSFAMNSLLTIVLFSSLILGGYSAVFFERQPEVPGHKGQCYERETNIFYKRGEEMKWGLKICGRKLCGGSDGKGSVYLETETCGKVGVPPGCITKTNLNLPYPHCCERVVCPKPFNKEAHSKAKEPPK